MDGQLGEVFRSGEWIAGIVEDEIPELRSVQGVVLEALRPLSIAVHEHMDPDDPVHAARSRIVLQACNDFLDVFGDSLMGRGRSAARATRSLYEHTVNHRWVSSRPDEALRYTRHAAIGVMLDLLHDTPNETDFEGKHRRSFRFWYRKRKRMADRDYDQAIAEFGPSFRSKWTQRSLFERAKEDELGGDDYERYRLLSAVIHGTAGGDLWQRREVDGVPILRVGASPALCPLTLSLGVRYFSILLDDLVEAVGASPVSSLRAIVDRIESCLPSFRQLMYEIDDDIWPTESIRTELLYVLHPDGSREWWLRDVERRAVIRADPVGFTRDDLRLVREAVEEIEAVNPVRQAPVLVHVVGQGSPRQKSKWVDQFAMYPHMRPDFWSQSSRKRLVVREIQRDLTL